MCYARFLLRTATALVCLSTCLSIGVQAQTTSRSLGGDGFLPRVTLQSTAGTATEGSALDVTVRIDYANDAPDGEEVVLGLVFLPGSSTAGEADFAPPAPPTFVFSGEVTGEEKSVSIVLTEGDGLEDTESAVFEVVVVSGEATVWGFNQFTATILDTDVEGSVQVQLIHNAADPAAAVVDITLAPVAGDGSSFLFEDIAFQSATGFFEVPAGTYLATVTPTDAADALIEQPVTVLADGIYQLIAGGVGDPFAFEDNPDGVDTAARLFVNAAAQTASVDDFNVALNVVHGSTDTPMVDVRDGVSGDTWIDDAAYGDLTGYLAIAPTAQTIQLTDEVGVNIARYAADLGGLEGEVVTLLASGFLTPENDQDGPAFGVLAVLADGTSFLLPRLFKVSIGDARDLPLGSLVDIEGVVTRALGDFVRMQDATGGLTIRQTSGPFSEDVADGTITGGTMLGVTGVTSEFNGLFQINGGDLSAYEVLGTTSVPAAQPVTLADLAAGGEGYESELVEVIDLTIEADGDETFEPATTYVIADPTQADGAVTLRVPNEGDTEIDEVAMPPALFTFTGVLGQFSPDAPAAGYQLLPVLESDVTAAPQVFAAVQIIHNAPDPALAEVDVFVDGQITLPDFAFRTATEFVMLPAGVEIEVAVAPGDSDGSIDAFFTVSYTLDEGVAYQLIATGVREPEDFAPNPEGVPTAFTLIVNAEALTDGTGGFFIVNANGVHGVPDAPAVDVVEETTGAVLIDDVSYTDLSPYASIPIGDYALNVTPADDNSTALARFSAELTGFGGDALTVLASGFLAPGDNQGGPGLGLLVVETDGTTSLLEPLLTSAGEETALPVSFALRGVYPNPLATAATVRYDLPADARVSFVVYDVLGREVQRMQPLAVAAGADHALAIDGRDLRSGAYLYRLTAEMPSETAMASGRITVVR